MSQVSPNPEPPASSEPPHTPQPDAPSRRRSLWNVLPWILLAVAGLVIGTQLVRRPAVTRTAPAAVPASVPMPPATPPSAGPLTVTLSSAGSGKHIRVGTPETISAFAGLPDGESATVAVSYTKNGGAKALLTLAQGSLSSTTWTPTDAGRYEFTASALDSRKSAAFSRPLTIWVDAPKAKTPKAETPKIAAQPTLPKAAIIERPVLARVPAAVRAPVRHKQTAVTQKRAVPAKALVVRHVSRVPKAALRRTPPHRASYRVAAARFTYRPVAETLAEALRRRGFHAFVRVGSDSRGKPTYSVETGDYANLADARQQEAQLKHDGYPAFQYQAR